MSHSFELSEPIIHGLVELLEEKAGEVVEAINATVTDGFTIQAPQKILDHLPVPTELDVFPVIAIGDGPIPIENDLAYMAESKPLLCVEAILQHPEPRPLTWMMRRYLQLIMGVIQTDRNLKNTTQSVIFHGVEPGGLAAPREPESQANYIQWNYVWIECRREEA